MADQTTQKISDTGESETSSGVLLGVCPLREAKRIQSRLELLGVPTRLGSNPDTCTTGGCSPTVELWALHQADLPAIQAFFVAEKDRNHQGLDFDPAVTEAVFDPTQSSALCPACGTQFSTTLKECPDCGLVFFNEG